MEVRREIIAAAPALKALDDDDASSNRTGDPHDGTSPARTRRGVRTHGGRLRAALGVDLGATHFRQAVVDIDGNVMEQSTSDTPSERARVVPMLQQSIRDYLRRMPELEGVGIGVPGTVRDGVVHSNNLSWQHFPLRDVLGIESTPVLIENDINAGAVGELTFGAIRGMRNAILLTVSTGIGAGILIDGKLYQGAHGIAGEVGHTVVDLNGILCGCGRRGCWEMIASGTAHRRRIREAFLSGTWPNLTAEPSAEDVTERARSGDRAALALVRRTARYLAIGIANLVNQYDPEAVVLTGGFARNTWDLIYSYVSTEVEEQALVPDVRLLLSRLEDDAGVLGAASLVFHSQRTSP